MKKFEQKFFLNLLPFAATNKATKLGVSWEVAEPKLSKIGCPKFFLTWATVRLKLRPDDEDEDVKVRPKRGGGEQLGTLSSTFVSADEFKWPKMKSDLTSFRQMRWAWAGAYYCACVCVCVWVGVCLCVCVCFAFMYVKVIVQLKVIDTFGCMWVLEVRRKREGEGDSLRG